MANSIDQRRHSRHKTKKNLQIFPVLPSKSGNIYEVQNKPLPASTVDISEGGAGLEISARSLTPQSLLKLTFKTPFHEEIEVYAKIIWSDKSRMGVHFILSDQAVLKAIKEIKEEIPEGEKAV